MARVPDVVRLDVDEVDGARFQDYRSVPAQGFASGSMSLTTFDVWGRGRTPLGDGSGGVSWGHPVELGGSIILI